MGVYLFDRKIGTMDDFRYVHYHELVLRWGQAPNHINLLVGPDGDNPNILWRFPWPFDQSFYLEGTGRHRYMETAVTVEVPRRAMSHSCEASADLTMAGVSVYAERRFPHRTIFKCQACGDLFSLDAPELERFSCWVASYALENATIPVQSFDLEHRVIQTDVESLPLAKRLINGLMVAMPANRERAKTVGETLFALETGSVVEIGEFKVRRNGLAMFELTGAQLSWETTYDAAVNYLTAEPDPYLGLAAQLLEIEIEGSGAVKEQMVSRSGANCYSFGDFDGSIGEVGERLIELVGGVDG